MRADNDNNLFTPATLAEAWGCSEQHVRNLLNRGELEFFRLGKRLIRIRGEAVEKYQCRMTDHTRLPGTEGSSASSSKTRTVSDAEYLSALETRRRLKLVRQAHTKV